MAVKSLPGLLFLVEQALSNYKGQNWLSQMSWVFAASGRPLGSANKKAGKGSWQRFLNLLESTNPILHMHNHAPRMQIKATWCCFKGGKEKGNV